MTVTEKLVDSVDTFCASPGGCRACFVIIFIACFLHALSYGSNAWAEISEGSVEASQGLWNYCSTLITTPDYTCCETVHNFLDLQGRSIPAWLQATRVFQSVGLLTSIASLVFSILCTCVTPTVKKRGVQISAAVLNFIAGGILIGISIYGGRYRYESWMKSYFPSWSFAFSIIAGIGYLITGFIYIFAPSDSISVQPYSNTQEGQNQNITNSHTATMPRAEPTAPPMTDSTFNPAWSQPHYPSGGVWHTQQAFGGRPEPIQNTSNNPGNETSDDTCCICLENRPEIIFMPCRHQKCCENCAESVQLCPICRHNIEDRIKPYR
ncbi:uncharacterized protein LOC125649175 isoform X2 [Ostrea edulis]|uniref:uncharacterized protein LOC125649175 isoform X2 n=1 Tax=Ostrea edulis TaxID=37623 RepID=UPI0024AF3991|nr:uncharacterized protein LOC125649175 isoform X2 [Ostrea edulis]